MASSTASVARFLVLDFEARDIELPLRDIEFPLNEDMRDELKGKEGFFAFLTLLEVFNRSRRKNSWLLAGAGVDAQDKCLATLETKLQQDAEKSAWVFEGLSPISRENALWKMDGALADMNDPEKLEDAKVAAKENGRLFYSLNWEAPSNRGASVLVVDEATCEELFDVGIWSEE